MDCRSCRSDADCPMGSTCGSDDLCERVEEIAIDQREDCGESEVMAEGLPAGTYRVTALESAGSHWASGEYAYEITCDDLAPTNVRTAPGARYPSADAAFDAVLMRTEQVDFEGGDLLCGLDDTKCSDNSGEVRFRLELVCPSCGDGIESGDETDVDCGGETCPPCPE